jgi:hypothetical protein
MWWGHQVLRILLSLVGDSQTIQVVFLRSSLTDFIYYFVFAVLIPLNTKADRVIALQDTLLLVIFCGLEGIWFLQSIVNSRFRQLTRLLAWVCFTGSAPSIASAAFLACEGAQFLADKSPPRTHTSRRDRRSGFPKSCEIDLHGFRVREAKREVAHFLKHADSGIDQVNVITGKGHHSTGGEPKIRPALLDYFARHGYEHRLRPHNSGVIEVFPHRRSGHSL